MKENNNLNNEININRNFKVYMHTSPNGKRYIGITRQDNPEKRWGSNGCNYADNQYFWRAIQKNGWNNFLHEILFKDLTEKEAKEKEIELISFYDTTNKSKGYNITPGGDYNINAVPKPVKQYTANGKFIKEYKCIKSAANETGVNKSNISLCCNNKAKLAGGYIWVLSNIGLTKEHIDWCNSDRRSENGIAVHRYSTSGEFIQEYESFTLAGLATNANPISIAYCCKGEYKIVANSIWRYAWEKLTQEHIKWCNTLSSDSLKKKVNQYLRDGTFINTYNSIEEAYLKTGTPRCSISACCRGDYKTAGNFLWRFSNEKITPEYINWCNSIAQRKEKYMKTSVVQYTIKGNFVATYESLSEAERITGISRKSISAVCKGNKEHAGNFIWKAASDIVDSTAPLFSTSSKLT